MAKTNLVKMEVYFDLDTQSFIALDPETGEFRDFSVSKKSSTNKKKAYVYKMKIGPANIFSIFIFFVMVFITLVLGHAVYPYEANVF